ncbi:MAG: hypothetical protein GF400_00715 [Candidatus Eisenbacteria bacterium]|nr:hypothetical protein [Candidatus Eisenbacteria bacterium]
MVLVRRPVYNVRLAAFEGPLDLLLHLIRENEIDIYDIPIAEITRQYLEYLDLMESLDLTLAGEFMEMAATLIRIKVQMLLPAHVEEGEEEEDPREQLVRKLIEYKKFKEAAQNLSLHEKERRDYFPHGVDPRDYRAVDEEFETEEVLRDVTLFDLVDCLRDVLSRVPPRIETHAVDLETTTIEEQTERIKALLREKRSVVFASLFEHTRSRAEIVTAFIALLELVRVGLVAAVQQRVFGEILIELREGEGH